MEEVQMKETNKLQEADVERVDGVDRPATGIKFLIRKMAATGPSIQVGDALPDNAGKVGGVSAEDGELVDGSDLVQKIAKAVAAELAPGLDRLAEAIEKSGAVRITKAADEKKPVSKQAQGSDDTKTRVEKKVGQGMFRSIFDQPAS